MPPKSVGGGVSAPSNIRFSLRASPLERLAAECWTADRGFEDPRQTHRSASEPNGAITRVCCSSTSRRPRTTGPAGRSRGWCSWFFTSFPERGGARDVPVLQPYRPGGEDRPSARAVVGEGPGPEVLEDRVESVLLNGQDLVESGRMPKSAVP